MAHAVSQQSYEIGIGWRPAPDVASRGARVPARRRHGCRRRGLGLFVAALSTRIADLLYQTSPTDSFVFATVAGVLAIAGPSPPSKPAPIDEGIR
jgi:hypothetical protein